MLQAIVSVSKPIGSLPQTQEPMGKGVLEVCSDTLAVQECVGIGGLALPGEPFSWINIGFVTASVMTPRVGAATQQGG